MKLKEKQKFKYVPYYIIRYFVLYLAKNFISANYKFFCLPVYLLLFYITY